MTTSGQIDQLLEGLDGADFDDLNELDTGVGDEAHDGNMASDDLKLQDDSFFAPAAPSETLPTMGFMTARARPLAPPSAAALARARKLFLDDDDSIDTMQEATPVTGVRASSSQVLQTPAAKRSRLDSGPHSIVYPHAAGNGTDTSPTVPLSQSRPRPRISTPSARSFVADLFADSDAGCEPIGLPSRSQVMPPCRVDHGVPIESPIDTGDVASPTALWGFVTGGGRSVAPINQDARGAAIALFGEAVPTGASEAAPPTASWGFVTGGGRSVAPTNQGARRAAMALFGEADNSTSAGAPSTPARVPAPAGIAANARSGLPRPAFATPRIAQLGGVGTPSRTPLANKTNILAQGASPSMAAIKLPKPIEIKTPLSAKRRIGLGGGTPGLPRRAQGFVTPFRKNGARTMTSPSVTKPTPVRAVGKPANEETITKHYVPVFDLTVPSGRKGWWDAYLYPGFYSSQYLAEMGIPEEIWQLGMGNAHLYQFVDDNLVAFGTKAAYIIMRRDGCHLATERWVENHWSLILWKLAGMVHAKPDLLQSLWRWEEVLNQLKYRYEREFGAVQRPIIRKVQEHDASAATPMILCVSGITFPAPTKDEEGKTIQHRPYLDLTDGWYRILAEVDDCLARAIRRGRIAVGRKLGVAAAKLESSGDGAEVLDAYEKSRLVISGNSTHLARWDSKLGAQHQAFIASLASLSVDGGLISMVDVRVEKVYPLAFMNGSRAVRDPPWDEREELERQEKWNERYSAETARLQDSMQKRLEAVEDLAGTLWSQAEDLRGPFGEPPDTVDADFEDLLEAHDAAAQIRRLPPSRLYHLAVYARVRVEREMAEMRDDIEAEMKVVCPPRDVRDFRMVRLVDAWTGVKESTRTAMLNVWDARQLGDEIQEGKRYLISSLVPAKNGQWALPKPGSGVKPEVYLHTRRDTRWSAVEE